MAGPAWWLSSRRQPVEYLNHLDQLDEFQLEERGFGSASQFEHFVQPRDAKRADGPRGRIRFELHLFRPFVANTCARQRATMTFENARDFEGIAPREKTTLRLRFPPPWLRERLRLHALR